MPTYKLSPGEIFDRRFRVESQLGQGGMATVYQVSKLGEVATRHALKLIHLPAFPTEESMALAMARFRNEAATMVEHHHPHIVGVHEYGVAEDGTPYLLMELLRGEDLGTVLKRTQTLPWSAALAVIQQAAEALGVLHAAGRVHRDLSPGNLFLCKHRAQPPEESVFIKLLDFGISTHVECASDPSHPKTLPGFRVGNPPYMAPEAILKQDDMPLDGRADQFSLGCILFEMLAGWRAFLPQGGALELAFGHVLNSDPLDAELPEVFTPALREVLARALSKDPAERYASIAEFADALTMLGPPRSHSLIASGPAMALSQTGAGEPKYVTLLLSPRTLYWIGLLSFVTVLGIVASQSKLVDLARRLGFVQDARPGELKAQLNPDPQPFAAPPPPIPAPQAPDAGRVAGSDPQDGGDRKSVPSEPGALVASGSDPLRPDVASGTGRKPKRRLSPSFMHEIDPAHRVTTEALLRFYEETIRRCMKSHPRWTEITITRLKRFYVSGLSTEENLDLGSCLQRELPVEKPWPRKTRYAMRQP